MLMFVHLTFFTLFCFPFLQFFHIEKWRTEKGSGRVVFRPFGPYLAGHARTTAPATQRFWATGTEEDHALEITDLLDFGVIRQGGQCRSLLDRKQGLRPDSRDTALLGLGFGSLRRIEIVINHVWKRWNLVM